MASTAILGTIGQGSYGVSPVPRPAAPSVATGTGAATINAPIASMKAQGLLS